ncbi:MAG TPA: HU family DNA-binding protein [Trichocoleus sp.]
MNKGDLVDKVAEKASVTKKDADAALTAVIDSIMEAVAGGEKVTLVGFGSFEPRSRAEREGRNPKTGETMKIPAATVPAFSAGKLFKERVHPPGSAAVEPEPELAAAAPAKGGKAKK